jgi:hypothetical protein
MDDDLFDILIELLLEGVFIVLELLTDRKEKPSYRD